MPLIEVKDLFVTYEDKKTGPVTVFSSLSLEIPSEKITCVLGPSGCGKTTLLNVIAGLYQQDSGLILFDGKDTNLLTIRDRDLSYVKQDLWLYPLKTIFDNIAFPLKFCAIDQNEVYYRVRDIAKKMDIEHCLTRKPKQISLGQQKRVALARALVKEPSIVLFDEPLSSLDPSLKEEMLRLIVKSTKELKSTVIYVTHDLAEALKVADHLIVFDGSGEIIQGSKKAVLSSSNDFIKELKHELDINMGK